MRRNALFGCEEAKRQLLAGSLLSAEGRKPKTVTVLEKLFGDKDLFLPNQQSTLHAPFVTPQTPFAQSPQQIRGCNSAVVMHMFQNQLLRKCSLTKQYDQLCKLYFYPPSAILSHARKSRPAVVCMNGGGADFNGANNDLVKQWKLKSSELRPSVVPLDYAVWRGEAARTFRRALFNAVNKDSNLDGLYLVRIWRVPTQKEADTLMADFVNLVYKIARNSTPNASKDLKFQELNSVLAKNHQPLVPVYFPPGEWGKG